MLWLAYDTAQAGSVVSLRTGQVISGPTPSLRLPLEDLTLQFGATTYRSALSPDMHLAALEQDGRLMIWDVLTGAYTEVAPDLEGEKIFIGWIPDPDAWEAALQAGAP